jgi:hypothetical protein
LKSEKLFYSVSIVVWLERSLYWKSQVLILGQLGQFDVENSQMRRGNLLIQLLGRHLILFSSEQGMAWVFPRKIYAIPSSDEKSNILFPLTWSNGLELFLC